MARSDDRGTTVAELAVVMVVSSIVLALAVQFVISIARDANAATVTGHRVDSVRMALDGVERQVRSGDALYLESAGGPCQQYGSGSNCLRVATEVDGTTSCVQLQLIPDASGDGSYDLRTRSYSPTWASDGAIGAWRQVANSLAPPTTTTPPFTVGPQSGVGVQALTVEFAAPEGRTGAAPITLTATYVPRNALYASNATCAGGSPP
jgi:Tfp pilus assembly protein PilW